MAPTISALWIYPIKSCAGISVTQANLTTQGLPYDRRWMVVDEESGRAITQRTHPVMATIRTALPPAVLEGGAPAAGAALVLSAPSAAGEVRVPLDGGGEPQLRPAKVWAWSGVAADEGDEAAAWLSAVIGKRARLVRYLGSLDPAAPAATAALAARAVVEGEGAAGAEGAAATLFRAVSPEFVPWGAEVAFADGFPVLVATTEALDDLNSRLDAPVPMDRFRPNIVLTDAGPAWADDRFGAIQLGGSAAAGGDDGDAGGGGGGGGVEVRLVKPCSRCTVPLVDQASGTVAGKEPIKTMQGFRSGRALGWGHFSGMATTFFGFNGQPMGAGMVRVGDPAHVLRTTDWAAAA